MEKFLSRTLSIVREDKSLDDVVTEKIESTNEGEVYAITNPAWPDWIKIGKAVRAMTSQRISNSPPHRDTDSCRYLQATGMKRNLKCTSVSRTMPVDARRVVQFDESTAILLFLEETMIQVKITPEIIACAKNHCRQSTGQHHG